MKKSSNVHSNSNIVLVHEEKDPKQHWRLPQIIELIKSKNGKVRAVKVITGKNRNIANQPVNQLSY